MVDDSLADEFDRRASNVRAQKLPDERPAVLQRLNDAMALAQRYVDTLARYARRADADATVLAPAPVATYGALGLHPGVVLDSDNSNLLEQAPSMHAKDFWTGLSTALGRPEFHVVTGTRPLDSLFEQIFVPLPWDHLEIGDRKPRVRVRGMDAAWRIEADGTSVSVFYSEFGA